MSGFLGIFRIPELRKKIIFTLGALIIYRLGVHVPTPGVDPEALKQFLEKLPVLGMFNLFTGGALEKFSIFALGVMPYISASIIMQLLTIVWPYLHELQKEGGQGRKKITQYTRYGTVILCLIQGYGIATGLEASGDNVVIQPGIGFRLLTALTLTGGTVFLMWLGEQISERGIGNGTSMIIFGGIASSIIPAFINVWSLARQGEVNLFKILVLLAMIFTVFFVIIFIERGQRRIPIQYAKRVVGQQVYGGQTAHLPLKVNMSGVIPPIFASSLIMFPTTIASFVQYKPLQDFANMFHRGLLAYNVFFVSLIVFFCYFYTSVVFKTEDVAENLKKQGGFVPGVRPGQQTIQYIDGILSRLTLGGAVYISAICVLPDLFIMSMNYPQMLTTIIGGTSVLILVGVAMDTTAQIDTYRISKDYDGFTRHFKIKGRSADI